MDFTRDTEPMEKSMITPGALVISDRAAILSDGAAIGKNDDGMWYSGQRHVVANNSLGFVITVNVDEQTITNRGRNLSIFLLVDNRIGWVFSRLELNSWNVV
jgi:hypothetical protein